MWKHESKYKGQVFLGSYEFTRAGVRKFVLKNNVTGRELSFSSWEKAKAAGFKKI